MKISLVIPVFNEAQFLTAHLELAAPHVDEIILVDGSPQGVSTDDTSKIALKYENVKRIEFEQDPGQGAESERSPVAGGSSLADEAPPLSAWDKRGQLKAGVDKASGDVVILTSVDTVYGDYGKLCDALRGTWEGKVWYSLTVEFFLDLFHIRLVLQDGRFPMAQVGYTIVRRDFFCPSSPEYFSEKVGQSDRIYLPEILKYHYGWVRDFEAQVQKHVRNVKAGWWGEYGAKLLKGDEKTLEMWAISHVLHYSKEIVYPYCGSHPLKALDLNYKKGFDKVLKNFKGKYGENYYDCVAA